MDILLDSSPLALLCSPVRSSEVIAIAHWASSCLASGHQIYLPEIIDYELRRELLRAGKTNSVLRLNGLKTTFDYLPITTEAILYAADLWAQSRRAGMPTSDPKKLDVDVILAAQARTLAVPASGIIVATANVAHISRFVSADLWTNISP